MKTLFASCLVGVSLLGLARPALAHVAETMDLSQGHVKVVAYDLVDRTDDHAELVFVREWLVGHTERKQKLQAQTQTLEQ